MTITETKLFCSTLDKTHDFAPYFGGFTSRSYSEKFITIPNKELLPSCQKAFNVIYKILTGSDLKPEGTTLAISSDAGSFKALYFPVVANQDGKLVLKWGDEILPLNLVRDKATKKIIIDGFEPDTDTEIEFSIGDFPVYAGANGKYYSNPGLQVMVYKVTAEKSLLVTFPFRTKKDTKIEDVPALARAFQLNPLSLLEVLGSPEFGSFSPTYPLNQLPEYTDFQLKAIRIIKGEKFVLDLHTEEPVILEDAKGTQTTMQGDFSVWSAASINNAVLSLTSGLTGNTLELPEGSILRMQNIKIVQKDKRSAQASIIVPSNGEVVDDINFDF